MNIGNANNDLKTPKLCERCGTTFECNAGDIKNCACNKINITKEIRAVIRSKYKNCLCMDCLKKLGTANSFLPRAKA